jgi:pimeloyl-ACP methyl ester carboxylesterase
MNDQSSTVRLQDGRRLGYAEYGDPAGRPVLLFHGTPGSRLYRHPDDSIARSLRARVIVPDRPGFGLSDLQPGRTLLDWPRDVIELADALRLDRFAVAGVSGGGPYVAACAYAIPQRLTRAALISGGAPFYIPNASQGMAPTRKIGYAVVRHVPWLLEVFLWCFANPRRNAARFSGRYRAGMAPADLEILNQPEIEAMKVVTHAESARQGVRGFALELRLFAQPWGFRLEDIRAEVHLWHGDQDTSTPLVMAQYMAKAIPGCRATYLPSEGHAVFFKHWREILAVLIR